MREKLLVLAEYNRKAADYNGNENWVEDFLSKNVQ
jgi:hypothetical protein